MAQIRLTRRGQALAARCKSQKGVNVTAHRKDEFRMYTLKNTGEKVRVNKSDIFPKKGIYETDRMKARALALASKIMDSIIW